ncbi:MAG: hypothetical protein AAGA58_07250, partial [Verrucomicrobiota bacterium]
MHTVESDITKFEVPEASFGPANRWVEEGGKRYVSIEGLEEMDPFFFSLATAEDQWFFCSSHGSLSAGRRSPETALFPYYTVDKIINNWNTTGPWTAVVVGDQLWNPFRPSIALLTPCRRRLMKSELGDEVVFDELHEGLGLRMVYRWQLSNRFGFVRKARIVNESGERVRLRFADGLDNFLPPGIGTRMQLQYSSLADAYKVSELHRGGALMVHRLAAGITDEPIPLESLLATTVWTHGLGEGRTFMDRREAERFLRGQGEEGSKFIRAKRGAMILGRERTLEPGESIEWIVVADIDQTQTQVGELRRRLGDPDTLVRDVDADIREGQERLRSVVASSDGFQQTADRDVALYHFNNTLCNILRGGVPENGYEIEKEQFRSCLECHNRPLLVRHHDWFEALPPKIHRIDLLESAKSTGDLNLLRLTEEHLPLILSRRHGDPSRPWNQFDIRLRDEHGRPTHHFEGNWRDIFQNWEGLALSFPDYLSGFISMFLNASTIDGFNPYRITSCGVDWETPDPDDPWASIGYWGDHQIIYLLKLLELENAVQPDRLSERLNSPHYVFADVPYRLAGWERTLEDPRHTVTFDWDRHDLSRSRLEDIGADGLLLRNGGEELMRATLLEKLLIPAAIKLANLVPGGGIWLNTQRPEWNDANNALAGCGLSVVTTAYLYRYVDFVETLIGRESHSVFAVSKALRELLEIMGDVLGDPLWTKDGGISGSERFGLVKTAGVAAEKYREKVYRGKESEKVDMDRHSVLEFLAKAKAALEATLRQNRRSDGLWHSYNVLDIQKGKETLQVERLSLMLEGQVAILSAGLLDSSE